MTEGFIAEEDLFPFLSVLAEMVEYEFGAETDWLAVYHAIYSDPDAGEDHWVSYRFAGSRTAELEFAWESGSGVVLYRLSSSATVEHAAGWVLRAFEQWTVTQDGRPLGRDGQPRDPYGRP